MKISIGFMGLGIMGRPMAHNLLKAGYPLTVWNRTAEKTAPLLEAGAKAAEDPRKVAEASEVIFTMVTDGPQVREIALGPQGIIHGAKPGAVVVDMSSTATSAARDIAQELAQRQIHMLDAPVSGGPEGAAKGSLSIMVGGDENIFRQVLPILQVLGGAVTYVGPQGTGQLMKLCNQIACCLNILGMSEAFALARRAGVDLAKVREVLMGGAADSWMLRNWAPKIINDDYSPGFTVANFQKDLRNILQESAELRVS
ncbi:MAG: NAD-binding protein, partial [Armatimonadetes bacterium]|nr:NAD-binding protein [Armatimonadota bacterium]NIM23110.1 NAD-binding protein [Armatimonadota bacterium]NIM66978.1 NAD-binding protein [Armatimonadota bacterium]NIM75512.1 NAD-binding protein [Armatimonadota bacterium]NIN05167.1 NAD-binding protein [Armatimonadota bacterium]